MDKTCPQCKKRGPALVYNFHGRVFHPCSAQCMAELQRRLLYIRCRGL